MYRGWSRNEWRVPNAGAPRGASKFRVHPSAPQELGHLSPFSLVNDINLLTVLDSFALIYSSENSASAKPGG